MPEGAPSAALSPGSLGAISMALCIARNPVKYVKPSGGTTMAAQPT